MYIDIPCTTPPSSAGVTTPAPPPPRVDEVKETLTNPSPSLAASSTTSPPPSTRFVPTPSIRHRHEPNYMGDHLIVFVHGFQVCHYPSQPFPLYSHVSLLILFVNVFSHSIPFSLSFLTFLNHLNK